MFWVKTSQEITANNVLDFLDLRIRKRIFTYSALSKGSTSAIFVCGCYEAWRCDELDDGGVDASCRFKLQLSLSALHMQTQTSQIQSWTIISALKRKICWKAGTTVQ